MATTSTQRFPSDTDPSTAMARRADVAFDLIRRLKTALEAAPIAAADWGHVGTMGSIVDDLEDLVPGIEEAFGVTR